MSSINILPAGLLPKEALPLIGDYARGRKGEYEAQSLIKAMMEICEEFPLGEDEMEAAGWAATRGAMSWGWGAAPFFVLNAVFNALFGDDRSCTLLVVNNSPTPLAVQRPAVLQHGEQWGVPEFPSIPRRHNYIPARTEAAVAYGMWAFQKSKILGISTAGTMGVLDFGSDPDVLPRGFRVGWDVPQYGATSCALGFDTTMPADKWSERAVADSPHFTNSASSGAPPTSGNITPGDGTLPMAATALKSPPRQAWCAHSTKRENHSMLVVLVEARKA